MYDGDVQEAPLSAWYGCFALVMHAFTMLWMAVPWGVHHALWGLGLAVFDSHPALQPGGLRPVRCPVRTQGGRGLLTCNNHVRVVYLFCTSAGS